MTTGPRARNVSSGERNEHKKGKVHVRENKDWEGHIFGSPEKVGAQDVLR